MTVMVDSRYAQAKQRLVRSDDEVLSAQFATAYGARGALLLASLTGQTAPEQNAQPVRRGRSVRTVIRRRAGPT